jgi:hypothetical protein
MKQNKLHKKERFGLGGKELLPKSFSPSTSEASFLPSKNHIPFLFNKSVSFASQSTFSEN